jgi:hypothetical protein
MRETTKSQLRERALAAYERGDEDALARLAEALGERPNDGGLLIAEARARSAAGDPQALSRLHMMLRQAPDWLDGHVALAQLRWEGGQHDTFLSEFEVALRRMPGHAGLWFRYINAIAGGGAPARAADVARSLRHMRGDGPALRLIEAHHAGMAGDTARAGALLANVPDDFEGKSVEQARHRLRTGDAAGAAALLDSLRAMSALDSGSWALLELAWRAAGDPRHQWLIEPAAHARAIDLGLDGEELDALAVVLRGLHHAGGRPLGQSVREGTQTRGNLWRRREPEIAALRARLRQAVSGFVSGLREVDPDHPLRPCFDGALHLATGWSIRLQGGGYHISHIHAQGLLSSACYIALPSGTSDKEGWLELGRPPADLPLDLPPLATLEPAPGRLILFPSYLYHGTRPFRSGERLTVAFDAAPAKAAR